MKHNLLKESAVSPVIGVMLMLVVCIIIAAVVSGFAGSLGGNTEKAPQFAISGEARYMSYITITHDGGDPVSWQDIKIKTFIPSGKFKQMTYPVDNYTDGLYIPTNQLIYNTGTWEWAPPFSNGDVAKFDWTDCFPSDYYGVEGGACPIVGESVVIQIYDKDSNKMIVSKEISVIQ